MERRRERFQQELAEAWDGWNDDTADLVQRASEVNMVTGTDLSGIVSRLQARRDALGEEVDALRADPDDASLDAHAKRVQRALERFDRTFSELSTRTEAIYDKTVREAMAKRSGPE